MNADSSRPSDSSEAVSPRDGTAPWTPLFAQDQAQPYLAVIDEIATELLTPPAAWVPPEVRRNADAADPSFRDASLAGGLAGIAIFYAYLHLVRDGRGHDDTAYGHLNKAMDLVEKVPMPPSLYGGFPGIAWTATHLQELLEEQQESTEEDADPAEDIDEALAGFLSRPAMPGNYDVVSGLVGQGVYALERLSSPQAVICLERVVDRLGEISERRSDGITWLTPPEVLPPHQREEAPNGYYNLGVAHGIPGVIALLGGACAAGVARDKARELLDGAVSWLLAHRFPAGSDSAFSYWLDSDLKKQSAKSSRCAWCYGDPGLAAALFYAARCVGHRDWEREALAIALAAADKSFDQSGVTDAGICHGAVGLAHIYNRFWQATGREEMARAARYWFQKTLDLRRPGEDVAGFPAFRPLEEAEEVWVPDAGLLTGAAGIALAFLAGVSNVTPQWDRMLLVSIPPRS